MRRVTLVGVTMAVICLPSATTTANERWIGDPDDSPSRIDIARVRQGHYFEQMLYRVVAHEPWEPQDLGDGRLVISFNTDDRADVERRAILEYVGGGGGQMRARVMNQHGRTVGRATYRRPSSRSVELWFKRGDLGDPRSYSAWIHVRADGRDRAPDEGELRHRLQRLCMHSEPTITGTHGNDSLRGTKRDDVIHGFGGDDEIRNVGSGDTVCGGGGADVIEAGRGWIFLRGGAGSDRLSLTGPRPRPCDDTNTPEARASCAYPQAYAAGGGGNDLLVGGHRHEALSGGKGDDVLRGLRWSDGLHGGPGHDTLRGGGGNDSCRAGETLRSCEN